MIWCNLLNQMEYRREGGLMTDQAFIAEVKQMDVGTLTEPLCTWGTHDNGQPDAITDYRDVSDGEPGTEDGREGVV